MPRTPQLCEACKRVELAEVQWATEGLGLDSLGYLFAEIVGELHRARSKFPSNAHLNVALAEEVGELGREFLDGGSRARIREEAIQVACVAIRLALEGDSDFDRNFAEPVPDEYSFTIGDETFTFADRNEAQAELDDRLAEFSNGKIPKIVVDEPGVGHIENYPFNADTEHNLRQFAEREAISGVIMVDEPGRLWCWSGHCTREVVAIDLDNRYWCGYCAKEYGRSPRRLARSSAEEE